MKSLFSSPLRVYLALFGLVLVGIYCGTQLPISLFPNSSKPRIEVSINYGNANASEFLQSYGTEIESQLRGITTAGLRVEEVRAAYFRDHVEYEIEFEWGDSDLDALKEVNTVVRGYASRFTPEVRNSVGTWAMAGSGFISVSFKSATRTLDQIYDLVDSVVMPQITRIPDAGDPYLWNPSEKNIQIEINPERMASLRLMPGDIMSAIEGGIQGSSGGSLSTDGRQYSVVMPRTINNLDDLSRLLFARSQEPSSI